MRAYYYLLFRLYSTLSKPEKQNDEKTIIYLTVSTSTFIIYFLLYTILAYVDFYFVKFLNEIVNDKTSVLFLMLTIGFLNYRLFVKNKKFLNYNFKPDKRGGYAIIGFIVLLALMFVLIANKNREKIFKEREKARIENTQ